MENNKTVDRTDNGQSDEARGYVALPRELTAENGAKALLIGEFHEEIEIDNPEYCGCGDCDFCDSFPEEPEKVLQRVTISWPVIKEIYKKAVEHFTT